jgi:3-phenylpropionate/cinnamic acid dioxygenase small subunit
VGVVATTGNTTRDEVTEVLVRYATGIDSRDWPLLRACFTDDCDADYGDIGHWRSGDEITEWMAQTHDPLGPTMHRITNVTISTEGEQVTTRSYVHAVLATADRATTIHAYGWYDDEFVTTPAGWRISRRRFTTVATELRTS